MADPESDAALSVPISDVVVEYVDNAGAPTYVQGAFMLANVSGDVTLVFYTEEAHHQHEVRLGFGPDEDGDMSVIDPGPFVSQDGTVKLRRDFVTKVVFNRTTAQRIVALLERFTNE